MKPQRTVALAVALLLPALSAHADGWLKITSTLGIYNPTLDILQGSSASYTDNFDPGFDQNFDLSLLSIGASQHISTIPGYTLKKDVRNNTSATPFTVKFYFQGNFGTQTTNYLTLTFPNAGMKFDAKQFLTLRGVSFLGQPITNKWDIKTALAASNSFTVIAGIMPAGGYLLETNYATFQLDFDPLVPNVPPVAANATSSGNKMDPVTGSFPVSDSDGTVTNVSVLNGDGRLTVTGVTNWTFNPSGVPGTNSYQFYATDNMGALSTTNTLTLTATNRPPVAFPSNYTGTAESSIAATLAATDPDGDPLKFQTTTAPANGSLSGTGSNQVYIAANNFYGPDSFGFTASDGSATSALATVSLTVLPLNREPIILSATASGTNLQVSAQVQPNRTTTPQECSPLNAGWSNLTALAQSTPMSTNLLVPAAFTIPMGTNTQSFIRLRSSTN